MAERNPEKILLAHGGGGQMSDKLIREHILAALANETLSKLGDSADIKLPAGQIRFTTDSYVVKPLFFHGGNIGKLAICGTINDLAVTGARPIAVSLSLIIETGFEIALLDKILESIGQTAKENNVEIVTGDTKTVEPGAADGIFINTAGIGLPLENAQMGFDKIKAGDNVIINGTIADHGMTIMSQRKGLEFDTPLQSDCAALWPLIEQLLDNTNGVRFMRDPTRGGVAVTCNEIARTTAMGLELYEDKLPVNPAVRAAADMLGFDVLNIANEGKFIAVVAPEAAQKCVDICRAHPLGKEAAIIGKITKPTKTPLVELVTNIGGRRIVQMPYGRELPRIC